MQHAWLLAVANSQHLRPGNGKQLPWTSVEEMSRVTDFMAQLLVPAVARASTVIHPSIHLVRIKTGAVPSTSIVADATAAAAVTTMTTSAARVNTGTANTATATTNTSASVTVVSTVATANL